MANLVTFAKKLWKDKVGGNTPITAAELNRMEQGVSDCATQINRLGDSVSSMVKKSGAEVIQLSWENIDGLNYLCVRVNYVLAVKIKANV